MDGAHAATRSRARQAAPQQAEATTCQDADARRECEDALRSGSTSSEGNRLAAALLGEQITALVDAARRTPRHLLSGHGTCAARLLAHGHARVEPQTSGLATTSGLAALRRRTHRPERPAPRPTAWPCARCVALRRGSRLGLRTASSPRPQVVKPSSHACCPSELGGTERAATDEALDYHRGTPPSLQQRNRLPRHLAPGGVSFCFVRLPQFLMGSA